MCEETSLNAMPAALRLKTLLFSSAILLFIFFMAISIALSVLTTEIRKGADKISVGMSSVLSAQSAKVHVLGFARANTIFALTNNSKYLTRSRQEEATIIDCLTRMKSNENRQKEQTQIDEVQESVLRYLNTRRALVKQGSLKKAILEASGPLEEALALLDKLIVENTRRADQALNEAVEADRLSDDIAVIGVIFAFLVLAVIVFGTMRYLYYPIIHIYNAISKFSEGIKNSRAPEEGISDLRVIAAQFNYLADQTNEFDKKRAQFLAGTAHDLRTPLTALKSTVELLKNHFNKFSEKKRNYCLGLIEKQIVCLESMTSGFLDTVRVESGEFSLSIRKVDLTQILRDAVELWDSTSDKHNFISKISHEAVFLECDPLRMNQILTNLFSNAIKYSPHGGIIEVELQTDYQMISIVIKDQGLGIPPREFGRIFEPFQRVNSAEQVAQGVGIGLWITKRLVEAHHGSIHVESEVGKGSTFKIKFPLKTNYKKTA